MRPLPDIEGITDVDRCADSPAHLASEALVVAE